MKKTVLVIFLAALLIVPTVVAIVNYNYVRFAPAKESDVTKVTIEEAHGGTATFDRDENGERADQAISLFFRLNSHKSSIPVVPDTIRYSTDDPYMVTLSTRVKSEKYAYYFSSGDPEACYMIDPNGNSFLLGSADAEEFLSSDFAKCYYKNSVLPNLILSGTYTVAPFDAKWSYQNFRGDKIESDVSAVVSSAEQAFNENVIFALSYEYEPDYCLVKVSDLSGNELFNDQKSNLGNFSVDSETSVIVEVTSKWNEDSERAYSGEASYKFTASVSPAPSFRLSGNAISRGGYITVSAKNIKDPEGITVKSEPELDFNPVFFEDEGLYRAIIPFDDKVAAGEYRLTFSSSGISQEILVTVSEKYFPDSALNVSGERADRLLESEGEIAEIASRLADSGSTGRMFDGYFVFGDEKGYPTWTIRGYGSRVIINGDDSKTFINRGLDLQYGWIADIAAANNGKVVYVGETGFTGKIVVIDHGCGLRSWYWNLSSVEVSEGDSVSRGDMIGNCGATGLTDFIDGGFHLAFSVGKTFFDPNALLDTGNGITFANFN